MKHALMSIAIAAALAGSAGASYAITHPRAGIGAAGGVGRVGGAGGSDHGTVTKADFDRLEGEIQDLKRRVAALEKGGHSGGGAPSPGHGGGGVGRVGSKR